ncbi:MAG TPA: glycosyltransferase [Dehalococcoidales bacterium]|nr:glycosyltransferase [Dehalococcoidales bacterium]
MISVVIPARNEERLIRDCLNSLHNQDYKGEYEVIVADNGSTDATADIARESGVRVISCGEIKSVFYARQAGAEVARGEIIAQADADTIYPPDWLSRIAATFESNPKIVAITGRFAYRDSPWWAKLEYFLRDFGNRITSPFGRPMVVSGATLAFRRNAFLAVNGYRGLKYSPDQLGICQRFSKFGKVVYESNLCVITSARSVQKPFFIIVADFILHLNKWWLNLSRHRILVMHEFVWKTRLRGLVTLLCLIAIPIIAVISYGYFEPTSPVFGKVYSGEATRSKIIALTFDDGPNEPYTSEILDILSSNGINATFFVIGENVELEPACAEKIMADGNVLGNHSYSHDANHALTEFGAKDLEKGEKAISDTLGVEPYLYRPPHGKKSPWELSSVKKLGMIEVTWNVSANDQHVFAIFGRPTPQQFADEIVKEARPGSIVLLHDGFGTLHDTPKASRALTVKALPIIITQLKAQGYSFVTVPQLLHVPAYIRTSNAVANVDISNQR